MAKAESTPIEDSTVGITKSVICLRVGIRMGEGIALGETDIMPGKALFILSRQIHKHRHSLYLFTKNQNRQYLRVHVFLETRLKTDACDKLLSPANKIKPVESHKAFLFL